MSTRGKSKAVTSPPVDSLVIRPKEMATLAGVTRATIYDWAAEDRIPGRLALGEGGGLFFNRNVFMRWLEGEPAKKEQTK